MGAPRIHPHDIELTILKKEIGNASDSARRQWQWGSAVANKKRVIFTGQFARGERHVYAAEIARPR
jgi:hypothetical protein